MDKAIKEQLAQRFSAQRVEGRRRIVFWKSKELLADDDVAEVTAFLQDVKVWVLTPTNTFLTKKLLEHDDTESDYLVYDALPACDDNDDWLLNIRLYSEEFHADTASLRMAEMGLEGNGSQRAMVNKFSRYMNKAERRERLAEYIRHHKPFHSEEDFTLGMMACLCAVPLNETTDATAKAVIASVFSGRDGEEADALEMLHVARNMTFAELVRYDMWQAFAGLLERETGYKSAAEHSGDVRLQEAAIHILLNAVAAFLPPGSLSALGYTCDTSCAQRCCEMAEVWRERAGESFHDIAPRIEEELKLGHKLECLPAEQLVNIRFFPCVDRILVQKLARDLVVQAEAAETVLKLIDARKTVPDSAGEQCFYQALSLTAQMKLFFKETADSFHYTSAAELWHAYEDKYYRMDTLYRQFHCAMAKCQERGGELYNAVAAVRKEVDLLYANGYLTKLGENWDAVSAAPLADSGYVEGIARQESFYANNVTEGAARRTVVIISDALRYEVAKEMAGILCREMQGEVSLSSMQAVFPTTTKFGMAALLPHDKLTWEKSAGDAVNVRADGAPTDGLEARDAVLKAHCSNSVAVTAKELLKLTKDQKRALVGGYEVVYIYQDVIDAAGHQDEDAVCPACGKAQEELLRIVKTMVHDLGAARVCITADHGFVYVNQPLTEADKATLPKAGRVEVKSRYALCRENVQADGLRRVEVGVEGFAAYTPREYCRIPKQGDSSRYVHGGASLQEMMVPLLEYHHQRNQMKAMRIDATRFTTRDAGIELLAEHRQVTNAVFRLGFYQTEPVGDSCRAAEYKVYFVDANGVRVSDESLIHADRTQAEAEDRRYSIMFHLKPVTYDAHAVYQLVVENTATSEIVKRYDFSINLPYSFDEL